MARAPERTHLAEERTEFAADRTALASERTYTAWVRTGLAGIVAGLAVLRFMEDVLAEWSLRLVAAALIVFGLFCFGAAVWRYWRVGELLDRAGARRMHTLLILLATAVLAAAGLIALANVWLVGR